jgi:hypothetical protein
MNISKRVRLVGHVAHVWMIAISSMIGWSNRKKYHLEELGMNEKITLKMCFIEVGQRSENWIRLVQGQNEWRVVVNSYWNFVLRKSWEIPWLFEQLSLFVTGFAAWIEIQWKTGWVPELGWTWWTRKSLPLCCIAFRFTGRQRCSPDWLIWPVRYVSEVS